MHVMGWSLRWDAVNTRTSVTSSSINLHFCNTLGEVTDLLQPQRRFHALRHIIAVHLLDAGADVAFVQDQ
jgi:site-specific recombinase XerD